MYLRVRLRLGVQTGFEAADRPASYTQFQTIPELNSLPKAHNKVPVISRPLSLQNFEIHRVRRGGS